MSVEAARAEVFTNLDEGTICPCCDRRARSYKFSLTSSLVRVLNALAIYVNYTPGVSVHPNEFKHLINTRAYTFAKFPQVAYFGLTERGKRTGEWQLTPKGVAFLQGRTTIPAYLTRYNNTNLSESEQRLTVNDLNERRFREVA